MRKFLSIVLLLCLLAGSLLADNNREFRATWSRTWDQYSSSMSVEQMKARTRQILDKHVEAGMNAVIWHIRQGGTVYYPSAIEPWGSYVGYSDPGYDPLTYAIEEAHKRGLELHGWFNTFHCSSTITGAPAAEHPEWVCRDGYDHPMGSSKSISPGLKEVRDYLVTLVVEIVNNYDLDGVHFDYVRWNEYDNTEAGVLFAKYAEENDLPDGILPPGMEEYLQARDEQTSQSNRAPMVPTASNNYLFDALHPESGGIPDSTDLFPNATPGVKFASWGDWRRGATDVFIKAVHDTVQQIKPWVKVSPAALGRYKAASWNGYYSVFQNTAKWFNEGWIDLITPMNYHWLTANDMYYELTTDWQPNIGPGIAAGRPYSVGPASYLISNWYHHKAIVEKSRTLSWVKGFQFYSYGEWKDSSYPEESSHTIFAYKTKHPSYAFLNSDVPATPSVDWVKVNDSSYTMTVHPGVALSEPQWFVVYRSEDSNIDVDSDEIMQLVYSDSAFTYDVHFDGYQLNASRYYYAATQCSRWWIESGVSNVANTDILPSILPQVLTHDPANTEIDVPNNKVVRIEFNKNMDAASIEQNLTISPEPANMTLSWDHPTWVKEDHLFLNISGSWSFDTEYTITLGGSTVDQVGLQLDGNRDGNAGDAYAFSFTISGADEEPPVISFSNPAQNDMYIDTDLPVTLMFDELLDNTSLVDRIQFRYAGYTLIPSYTVFTNGDNRSYVNIKPNSYYPSNQPVMLELLDGITDTTGNNMGYQTISFTTDSSYYISKSTIDAFTGVYSWERPGFSGSTSGISDSQSSTTLLSGNNYVPGFGEKGSLRIICVPESENWFARIYSGTLTAVKNVDTSKTIQAYIYGDGSGYQFRIALAESNSASLNSFEVSEWYTVDWTGWRMIEWDLSDPSQFGEWGGMTGGSLDGTAYSVNSLQLKGNPSTPLNTVTCYVDQLRMVNKQEGAYPENHPPVIEAISDTLITAGTGIYYTAQYSDPDPNDILTMDVISDTTAIGIRRYTSPAEKFRLKPDEGFEGTSQILVIVRDNGVGELADTAAFTMTVVLSAVTDVPETFKVYPNYPNPFNPVTTLSFDLPAMEQVKIEVFNTRGQRVAVLADKQFDSGSWKLQFDASFLSSGVYFYKITAGDQMVVNRMTLLK